MPDLLDLMQEPSITRPVDLDGDCTAAPTETLTLPHKKIAWDTTRIELLMCADGLWAWSTSIMTSQGGYSYAASPKWGHFGKTRDSALYWAVQEIKDRCAQYTDAAKIIKWVDALT